MSEAAVPVVPEAPMAEENAAPNAPKENKRQKKDVAPKAKPQHPTYNEMIYRAIEALNDKKGSSRAAIKKYIKAEFGIDTEKNRHYINKSLNDGVEYGFLKQIKGSFKIIDETMTEKKKAAPKKKVASENKPKKASTPKSAKNNEEKKKAAPKKASKSPKVVQEKKIPRTGALMQTTKKVKAAPKPKTPTPKKPAISRKAATQKEKTVKAKKPAAPKKGVITVA